MDGVRRDKKYLLVVDVSRVTVVYSKTGIQQGWAVDVQQGLVGGRSGRAVASDRENANTGQGGVGGKCSKRENFDVYYV